MAISSIFQNKIILVPIIAVFISFLIKIVLIAIKQKKINLKEAIWSPGMPSSHAAFLSALVISTGIIEGISSSLFGVVLLFSLAYVSDLLLVFKEVKENLRGMKGQLGHSFAEIIVGIIIGTIMTFLLI